MPVGIYVRKPTDTFESFFKKSAIGCWIWNGCLSTHKRYPVNYPSYRGKIAHRISYERYRGPIPKGYHLDHVCKNTICVNPAHLEPVTPAENNRRSETASTLNAQKKVCKRGHAFDIVDGRRRDCSKCRRIRFNAWYAKNRSKEALRRIADLGNTSKASIEEMGK